MDFLIYAGAFCFYLNIFVLNVIEEKNQTSRALLILVTIVLTMKYPTILFEYWGVSDGLSFLFTVVLALLVCFLGRVIKFLKSKLINI